MNDNGTKSSDVITHFSNTSFNNNAVLTAAKIRLFQLSLERGHTLALTTDLEGQCHHIMHDPFGDFLVPVVGVRRLARNIEVVVVDTNNAIPSVPLLDVLGEEAAFEARVAR